MGGDRCSRRPTSERRPGMVEVAEQYLVEEFVPHSSIECLAETVLHRTTMRDVVPLNAALSCPHSWTELRGSQQRPRLFECYT